MVDLSDDNACFARQSIDSLRIVKSEDERGFEKQPVSRGRIRLEQNYPFFTYRFAVPAQMVDATLACSLLAGVRNPKVFLGR